MASVSISKTAAEKILKEKDIRSRFSGRPVIPRLHYYRRSYSTLNDGRTIEYGSGFSLSFVECDDAGDDQYLSIDLGRDCTLLVGPSTMFQAGVHSIDWFDQKFKLSGPVC
jgi:hypothetical protein